MAELIPLGLFLAACLILMAGYPVAFSLAGTALVFAFIGELTGDFDTAFLGALPNRLFGIMTNTTLLAVPLFVFMGVMLERSRVAENLLDTMAALFGRLRGGLGFSVTLVGMLLAASTGIVGATVVTMGLLVDRSEGTTTLFNDRYGIHRLYYHESADAFYFAAEAKAILAFDAHPGALRVAIGPASATNEEVMALQTLTTDVATRKWAGEPTLQLPPIVVTSYWWTWWWRWWARRRRQPTMPKLKD